MTRLLRTVLMIAFIALAVEGCKLVQPVDPPQEEGSLMDIKLSLDATVKAAGGDELSVAVLSRVMPLATDKVVLRPVSEGGSDVICQINAVGESSFTYSLPSKFQLGHYTFCLKRDNIIRGFGKVTFTSKDGSDIEPAYGSTVYGLVSCKGKGVPGVVVSDGFEVVQTDKNGVYQMASQKRNPYVFISVPSGYEVPSIGVLPLFYQSVIKPASTAERVDFTLNSAGDQTNHTMLFFGDIHLSTLNNADRVQFARFTEEVNNYIKEHPKDKIYAMTLGDMTWDLYWYTKNYYFPQYLNDINSGIKNLQVFHTIGNHDHDMKAAGDWDTVIKYKEHLCPNYYSFNIGEIHYVVLDDIECTNDGSGTKESRTHVTRVVSDDLEWLKKDLSFVSKDTPIVLTMHAPVYGKGGGKALKNSSELLLTLSGYKCTFVTGHTHLVYRYEKDGVLELNSGAVCAAWWYPGKYNSTLNISLDGSPAGYRIAKVTGKSATSVYKATGRDISYQFRVYDRNKIKITAAEYGVPESREETLYAEDPAGYHLSKNDNEIIINVWDYDPRWKVEAFEGNKALEVTQFTGYDPLFLIVYTVPHLKESATVSNPWHLASINHMFSTKASSATSTVTIKVTDDEGNVYTQKMIRPLSFIVDNYK